MSEAPIAPPEAEQSAPQVDVRRLLMMILIIVGGLGYFFWDDVRDVLAPPKIITPVEPESALAPDQQFKVNSGALEITFTKIGGAIAEIIWKNPLDGHTEKMISQDIKNRAFVVTPPGRADLADKEYQVTRNSTAGGVATVEFQYTDASGLSITKTFGIRSDTPVIMLRVVINNSSSTAQAEGYTLKIADAFGVPSDLGKDDALISVRSDRVTGHHPIRQISGTQEWPTEEERRRAGRGHVEAQPSLEWVALASKYFGVIVQTGNSPVLNAAMTFTRTTKSSAAMEIKMPAPRFGITCDNSFLIYAGPKDYNALKALPDRQQEAINYWYFGRPVTLLLKLIHDKVFANYGFAIIIVTVIFRLLMWPVTSYNLRSLVDIKVANAKLAEIDSLEPPRSDIKARAAWVKEARPWEDKQRKAQIGVFLPMIILLPALLVLYYTLNAGYEFYRQPLALWITDISRRDPIFFLPLLMGLAMVGQMYTMSEDPRNDKTWIWMPIAFTLLFSFFSAGLVLFWLVDTLVGWFQLWLIKKHKKKLPPHAEAATSPQ